MGKQVLVDRTAALQDKHDDSNKFVMEILLGEQINSVTDPVQDKMKH